ncbi:MAG TPA: polysaccharide biosynthesis/export family protein, partial [Candidatus Bathyarchaeia archaeon]|nr:polysaccharide biosynthesis/export family protein [Candidatus Bathyarchaeia archaeon]
MKPSLKIKMAKAAVFAAVCVLCGPRAGSSQNFANRSAGQAAEKQAVKNQPAETQAQAAPVANAAAQAAVNPSGTEIEIRSQAVPTFDQAALKGVSSTEELLEMVQPPLGAEMLEKTGSQYTLGATDVINISVIRHPEVSGDFAINQEGKIQYQFVGDIAVSGLTKEEAAEVIKTALSEYIVAPEVTVTITQYNSKVVYVVGEVFSPGKIFMRGDTMSVRDALVQAGLPRLSGVTKKSRLIKPSDDGRPNKKYINVYALIYEGDLRENDMMEPGDILYIPPTFLTKVMRAISPVAAPVGQAAGTRVGIDT